MSGGDKVLPYVGALGDDNPAMGLARQSASASTGRRMLRRQLARSRFLAANGRPLSIMFPMIRRSERAF